MDAACHEISQRLARRVRVAQGLEPADCTLLGGQVVNVFTAEVEPANIAIVDGVIAGVGPFDWPAQETVELAGQFVLPGLIDAHMHVESTMLTPAELARVVVPHGTAAMVADPHEVGNVLGVAGIEMLLASAADLPLDIFFMAPSCVPSLDWEDSGARLDADAIDGLLAHPQILGLAEVMDFPAVLGAKEAMLAKLAVTQQHRARIDGHAPGLPHRALITYAAAGIRSDHESTRLEEARLKAALGMLVQVREGSAARNLDAMLPAMRDDRLGDWAFCTDDIYPDDLLRDGHIDGLLRRAVAAGVPAERAVRHATLVPARHYGLRDRGAAAPGFRADLVVVDNLHDFTPQQVWHAGKLVAREGVYLSTAAGTTIPEQNTVVLAPIEESHFQLPRAGTTSKAIEVFDNQIVTRAATVDLPGTGVWQFDPAVDLVLCAAVERHRATGRVATALATGFGIRRPGALASTVAHDSHNIVAIGTDPRQMVVGIRELAEMGGGWVVVDDSRVVARLPLPVAGLLSRASGQEVAEQLQAIRSAARDLGCPLANPFGALSFMSLPVIPELRITTRGLFDVDHQTFVS